MAERQPVSISRGIEIQKKQVEELQQKALARYRDYCELHQHLDNKIQLALSLASPGESTSSLEELFEKKGALDQIGKELEELILAGFDNQSYLTDRWLSLAKRLSDAAEINASRDKESKPSM